VFTGLQPLAVENAPIAFVLFPLVAFAAFWFGPRGASLCVAILVAIAAWGTLQGYGPFVRADPNGSLLFLQSFMAVAQVTSLTLAAADVERRRSDAAARASEERLRAAQEQKVRERDDFLSIAAHELRTPITSLQVAVQLLLRRLEAGTLKGGADISRPLVTINNQTARLARLVGDLLDNVRLDGGRLAIEREQVDVTALLQRVVGEVRAMTGRSDITVAAAPVSASVDPIRLEQVVRNLLDNAVKFSPHGGAIEVTADPRGDDLRIAVRDHGIGVPPERRDRLFDRYQHDASWQHPGGLGLGLYVSRQIIERHGGSIVAEFPGDGGTRMVATLPMHEPPPPLDEPAVARGLDISQRLDALETRLREHDEAGWADRLNAAIAGGSTGTESLVRAGVVLRELASSETAKRVGCLDEARELGRIVGRQLRV
jgi:signal transduction histidine kinase